MFRFINPGGPDGTHFRDTGHVIPCNDQHVGYTCTRRDGHHGPHIAHDQHRVPLVGWG